MRDLIGYDVSCFAQMAWPQKQKKSHADISADIDPKVLLSNSAYSAWLFDVDISEPVEYSLLYTWKILWHIYKFI